MAFFDYREDQLQVESVSIKNVAEHIETPVYCYSAAALRHNFHTYSNCFDSDNSLICYAVKANSNQAVIRELAKLGAGADVVSEGELRRALLAGIPAKKIVYSGVAKTAGEIRFALQQGILQFNIESEPELEQLSEVASDMGMQAPIAFRINPDIDALTHAKISTGKASNKFGIPWTRAVEAYARAAELPGILVQGIDMHIGSQLTRLQPFEAAFKCLAGLTEQLRAQGHAISLLDIGGGLGINYEDDGQQPPGVSEYAALANSILGHLDCRILIEPGRSLVGDIGVLISRVTYIKEGERDRFLIIDAGMNDLLRPSLYDAYHEIIPVYRREGEPVHYHVVGPICETGDTFSRDRVLPPLLPGDLVAIKNAGAYGAVMASTYNTRPLVPEVMIDGEAITVIRARPGYDELIGMDSPDGV